MAIESLLLMLSFVTEPKMLLWVYDTLVDLYEETKDYEKVYITSVEGTLFAGTKRFFESLRVTRRSSKAHAADLQKYYSISRYRR